MRATKRALFTLVIWAGCLLAAEGVTRAIYAWRGAQPPTRDPSLAEEWQWAARHLEAGATLVPGVALFDPLLGWRSPPNRRDEFARTNAVGMRASREFPLEPEPGRRRLLLVGDSYTFGAGVRDEEVFARVLEDVYLAGWDVLNLAVPGYGTDQQLLSFEYEGRRYRPDVVALGFFVRDYERNLMRFRGYAKPRFALDGAQGLRLEGSPVVRPEVLLAAYRSGEREIRAGPSFLLELLRQRWYELRLRRIHAGAEGWRVLSELMERFTREVRASGAEPLWVLIPWRDALEDGGSRFATLEVLVEQRASELGLPYLSLTEPLRAHDRPDDPVFQARGHGGHFSAAGHRVAAQAIHAFMRARGWTVATQARSAALSGTP